MIPLPVSLISTKNSIEPPDFEKWPVQLGMPTPWHVAVASMIRLHTKKNAKQMCQELFTAFPTPALLGAATLEHVRRILKKLPLRNRVAANICEMSMRYCSGHWMDLRDLPGVGLYVADCVGYFCFGATDLSSGDEELQDLVRQATINQTK